MEKDLQAGLYVVSVHIENYITVAHVLSNYYLVDDLIKLNEDYVTVLCTDP